MGVEERNNFYDLFNAAGMILNRNEKRFLDKRIESFKALCQMLGWIKKKKVAINSKIFNLSR